MEAIIVQIGPGGIRGRAKFSRRPGRGLVTILELDGNGDLQPTGETREALNLSPNSLAGTHLAICAYDRQGNLVATGQTFMEIQ